ncbi:hypothetical protein GCM10020218_003590 [Dactylosporangium vinaceum]
MRYYPQGLAVCFTAALRSPKMRNIATDPRVSIGVFAPLVSLASSRGAQLFGRARILNGQVPYLRLWLEDQQIAYVLATRCDDTAPGRDWREVVCVADLATLPAAKWKRISCGPGAHGQRFYDWARLDVRPEWSYGFGHWVLARRSISDPTDIAYYHCYAPARTTLTRLAQIAGHRWPVAECFQQAKNQAGLDQHQVRDWRAWYAHITLSMATHALLTAAGTLAAQANPTPQQTC